MAIKPIIQNPERYSKLAKDWQVSSISESPNPTQSGIKPIILKSGLPLSNLRPLLKANGIIVKVNDYYLISPQTLKDITDSNNPHYDMVTNGEILVKTKSVKIGNTIKVVELKEKVLNDIINKRDYGNRTAGVTDVIYVNEGVEPLGVTQNLIDQINYTLTPNELRPKDEYSVVNFYNMVDKTGYGGHYTIEQIKSTTAQQETIFLPAQLEKFMSLVDGKLKKLEEDFNFIQNIFYKGIIPNPNPHLTFTDKIRATGDDSDDDTNRHSFTQYERTTIDNVTPVSATIKTEVEKLKLELVAQQQSDVITQQRLAAEIAATNLKTVELSKKLIEK
jgi:hypothetical protein